MQLRPYQNDLVEQVRQAWRDGFKAPCIVLGCGGGKSCIVAEIARRTTWNGKRVLFLVHRRELVDQIFRTFVRWGVLMDLCEIGMVQTFTRRLKKLKKPALIITDENHHSLAQSYKRIYEHFSDVPRVGVTATPVRLNGDGLGDVNDKLIIGVSTKWLIENHCLAPYDYYAPDIADLTGLHTKMGEYVTSDIEKAMIKQQKAFADAKDGSKAMSEAYQRLGVDIKNIGNSGDAFNQVIAALADMEDETTRNALANDIFGKSCIDNAENTFKLMTHDTVPPVF